MCLGLNANFSLIPISEYKKTLPYRDFKLSPFLDNVIVVNGNRLFRAMLLPMLPSWRGWLIVEKEEEAARIAPGVEIASLVSRHNPPGQSTRFELGNGAATPHAARAYSGTLFGSKKY